ncbi:MAG: S-layer homology domain-containing protein [Peptostreptococcaceae bacterium]
MRMLRKSMVFVMSVILSSNIFMIKIEAVTDISGHWAQSEIASFIEKGFIGGYEDNTFRPNNQITRAEFVTIFNKFFGLTNTSGKVFSDTTNHWAKDSIDIAVTNGITNGLSATMFGPNDPLTREQAATMISNYLKLADTNHNTISAFKDVASISSWAKDSVEGIVENGYMGGYSDSTFKPTNNITRAEAVVTLNRLDGGSLATPPTTTTPDITTSAYSAFQDEVLRLTNIERVKVGAVALQANTKLSEVATLKSEDMINNNYFSHSSPIYGSPFEMMASFGLTFSKAAENIAWGQRTPEEVVTAWMNSEGHKKNILNGDYTHIGIGVAKDSSGRYYWTQMFMTPK